MTRTGSTAFTPKPAAFATAGVPLGRPWASSPAPPSSPRSWRCARVRRPSRRSRPANHRRRSPSRRAPRRWRRRRRRSWFLRRRAPRRPPPPTPPSRPPPAEAAANQAATGQRGIKGQRHDRQRHGLHGDDHARPPDVRAARPDHGDGQPHGRVLRRRDEAGRAAAAQPRRPGGVRRHRGRRRQLPAHLPRCSRPGADATAPPRRSTPPRRPPTPPPPSPTSRPRPRWCRYSRIR